jgi:hypothetical protein
MTHRVDDEVELAACARETDALQRAVTDESERRRGEQLPR